jgi:DNA-binding LytR/AlgR family response regulator
MPEMSGLDVALRLEGKPYIFVTGELQLLKEALDSDPIYVMTKPVSQDKFNRVAQKAYMQIQNTGSKSEKEFFNVSGKDKVLIELPEIVLVSTLDGTPRNKKFYMRNGGTHIINRCSLEQVLDSSDDFIQINKAEVIHWGAVEKVEYDTITLKFITENNKPKQVILGQAFDQKLRERLGNRFN